MENCVEKMLDLAEAFFVLAKVLTSQTIKHPRIVEISEITKGQDLIYFEAKLNFG